VIEINLSNELFPFRTGRKDKVKVSSSEHVVYSLDWRMLTKWGYASKDMHPLNERRIPQ